MDPLNKLLNSLF